MHAWDYLGDEKFKVRDFKSKLLFGDVICSTIYDLWKIKLYDELMIITGVGHNLSGILDVV